MKTTRLIGLRRSEYEEKRIHFVLFFLAISLFAG